MTTGRPRRRAIAALGAVVLIACQSPPPAVPAPAAAETTALADWGQRYAALAATGGSLLRFDAAQSTVRIYVYRGGRAARLGHNHVLTAPRFGGYLYLPPAGAGGAQFDLEFRLDELQFDDPAIRAGLGTAFAAELTADDRANTRAHMLGDDNLQAGHFPFVRIHGLAVIGEGPALAAEVAVEMHGQRRTFLVPLTVEGLPLRAVVAGSLVLRQSDFGVQPYSALGGLIAVQDAVRVDVNLVAEPTPIQ
jgi:polyisoprenoid-binding protein YceI